MKKKAMGIITLVTILSLSFSAKLMADNVEGVKIDTVNFKSEHIQSIATSYDTDKNGYLTKSEADKITEIYYDGGDSIADRKVKSLDGIEHFTNLRSLVLFQTQVSEIDLSNNKS